MTSAVDQIPERFFSPDEYDRRVLLMGERRALHSLADELLRAAPPSSSVDDLAVMLAVLNARLTGGRLVLKFAPISLETEHEPDTTYYTFGARPAEFVTFALNVSVPAEPERRGSGPLLSGLSSPGQTEQTEAKGHPASPARSDERETLESLTRTPEAGA